MNKKLKIFLIIVISIILSFILAPYFGDLYEKIIGHGIGSWIGSCPECFEGYFISLGLLLSFMSAVFGLRLKKNVIFIIIYSLLFLITGDGILSLIVFISALVGLGLGEVIYLIKKKSRSNKSL